MTEITIEAFKSKKFDVSIDQPSSHYPYYLDIVMDRTTLSICATDDYFLEVYEALKNHLQSRGRLE